MISRSALLTTFTFFASISALVPLYGQCGGSGYTGETTCVSGATCVYSNEWYSQCLTGTAATTTTKATTAPAATATGIPAGAITIGKNGQGKYSTFAAALADTSSSVYYVYAGTYNEAVVLSRANLKIYGQTTNKLTYASNTVTISRSLSAAEAGSNDASGTVRVTSAATGVSLYNLNIENTYGQGSQAIALSVQAGTFAAYGVTLKGYQDTLLANKGTQFYGKSLIIGATDFIFGQTSSVWITGSTIQTVGNGWITASGRSTEDSGYYVIDKSTITGTGTTYLGRPWRNYARVVFQNSVIGSHVAAAGWTQWSTATPNIDHILFGEYNNSGAGAWKTGRASFATKLTAGISISTVLGSTSWIDSAYL